MAATPPAASTEASAGAGSTRTVQLLERLVALESTTAVSNLPVVEACEEVLRDAGAWTRRVPAADQDDKAGLLARIGPDRDGGVVLSGHTDCVPVEGQPWTSDPFTLVERDGVLVGRGATDMKGFIASVLAAAPRFADADLARPVWVLLTWDEEIGTVGAGPMTAALLEETTPACAIVGEPTSMRPVVAHKGVRSLTVVVHGTDGHSSKPAQGANAVVAAARLAARIDEMAAELRARGGDPLFDPPETTFNVATLHGGQAINIIPRRAELTFEYRPVPADDGWGLADKLVAWAERELLPSMRRVDPECRIEVERGSVVHGLAPETDPAGSYEGVAGDDRVRDGGGAAGRVTDAGAAERLVRDLLGFNDEAGTVPFGTDGGWHQQAGISTVVCGPGDIDQAHQPDEFVEPAQLAACDDLLTALAEHLQS